jgi:hypothetical protein
VYIIEVTLGDVIIVIEHVLCNWGGYGGFFVVVGYVRQLEDTIKVRSLTNSGALQYPFVYYLRICGIVRYVCVVWKVHKELLIASVCRVYEGMLVGLCVLTFVLEV